jgi:predicted TIM-barrel fold metal-dependent hydrolase
MVIVQRVLIVSGDGHVTPPIDAIVPYLERPARDLVDDLVRENWGFIDMAVKPTRPSVAMLERFDQRRLIRSGGEYGAAVAGIRLEQMDAEGIAAEVVHPHSQINASPFFIGRDADVRLAGARAYHRWLADFMAECDHRLFGVAEPGPCLDMDATLDELVWAKEHGFVAVSAPGMLPSPGLPLLYDDHFERFWSACGELGLVVSVHAGYVGTGTSVLETGPLREHMTMGLEERFKRISDEDGLNFDKTAEMMRTPGSSIRLGLQQPRRAMWQLMAGGVFDRHPRLKVALTEIRADWVPGTLAHLAVRFDENKVPARLSPQEYWERHFLVVPSSIHRAEVAMRHDIGLGQLGFGQDFPHWEGVWPDTLLWLQDAFRGVPEDELRAILGTTTATFYGLPLDRLQAIADRVGPHLADIAGDHEVDDDVLGYFNRRSGYLRAPDPVYPQEIDLALQSDLSELPPSA